ncbi:actin-related protein 4-like isoform X3 [Hordeum vulgare subsp. vulgare]|uniref:actin-related protein 4-like isoform X3 n=1 Tax=Hordeum vulgare subsp. vulgare TaxID=112509 RepID=UPI001D1A539A|nr:actin-related protein 4-like isoform X3 [Hordeum vulgare subsp. vulgare]
MYGGDEVSAIVIDVGSYSCKAGYAGDDTPKSVFPSVVGSIEQAEDTDEAKPEKEADSASDPKNGSKPMDVDKAKTKRKFYVGQELEFRRDHMEVISPMKDGTVTDWDVVDNIWNHAFRRRLLINPEEHPMLIAEPSINSAQQREKAAELMFEKYKVPALFLAKNAVLTSFASGRATSLVVDSGGGSTVVSAVHDGYVLQKSVATSPIGGEFLTDCMMKSLESKGVVIRPRYSFKKKEASPGDYKVVDLDFPNTTESYRLYHMRAIASDIKETVCRVPDTPFDEVAYANVPTTSYELPDGQTIEVGAERFKIPDILFNPYLSQTIPGIDGFGDSTSIRGLPRMVLDSVNRCDVDIRKELLSSILVKTLVPVLHSFWWLIINSAVKGPSRKRSTGGVPSKCSCEGFGKWKLNREAIQCLDWREHPCIPWVVPANVVLQSRVRRARRFLYPEEMPMKWWSMHPAQALCCRKMCLSNS